MDNKAEGKTINSQPLPQTVQWQNYSRLDATITVVIQVSLNI